MQKSVFAHESLLQACCKDPLCASSVAQYCQDDVTSWQYSAAERISHHNNPSLIYAFTVKLMMNRHAISQPNYSWESWLGIEYNPTSGPWHCYLYQGALTTWFPSKIIQFGACVRACVCECVCVLRTGQQRRWQLRSLLCFLAKKKKWAATALSYG